MLLKLITEDGELHEVESVTEPKIVRYHHRYFAVAKDGAFEEGEFEWLEPNQFTPYLLFTFSTDRALGGYRDFRGQHKSFEEAESLGEDSPLDVYQIVDLRNPNRVYTCRTNKKKAQDAQSAGSAADVHEGWNDGRK